MHRPFRKSYFRCKHDFLQKFWTFSMIISGENFKIPMEETKKRSISAYFLIFFPFSPHFCHLLLLSLPFLFLLFHRFAIHFVSQFPFIRAFLRKFPSFNSSFDEFLKVLAPLEAFLRELFLCKTDRFQPKMDIRNYIPKDISALEPPDEQQVISRLKISLKKFSFEVLTSQEYFWRSLSGFKIGNLVRFLKWRGKFRASQKWQWWFTSHLRPLFRDLLPPVSSATDLWPCLLNSPTITDPVSAISKEFFANFDRFALFPWSIIIWASKICISHFKNQGIFPITNAIFIFRDVAHVNCAMKEDFWKKNACVLCYKPLVAPQPPTKVCSSFILKVNQYIFLQFQPPRKGILKRTETLRCALCNNTRYQDEKSIKYDARFIRPCFCE